MIRSKISIKKNYQSLKTLNPSDQVFISFQIDKWTTNLLPSRQFGHVVLTTSDGIIDHEEAKKKHTGGKILGFFF